jgi:Hemerythrin HHE cation binding domain
VKEENVSVLMAEDHAEIDLVFRELLQAFEKGDNALVFRLVDFLWARLAVHIRAENLCLFPAILRAAANADNDAPRPEEMKTAIADLRRDHDIFMRALATVANRMRPHAFNPHDLLSTEQLITTRQVIETVQARLESHNRLEEEQVYRWPALLLSAEELGRLVTKLKLQLENLPPRFGADRAG